MRKGSVSPKLSHLQRNLHQQFYLHNPFWPSASGIGLRPGSVLLLKVSDSIPPSANLGGLI
jgi:hypothetical protein